MLNVNIVKIRVKFLYVPLPGPMSAPKSKNCGRFETPRPPQDIPRTEKCVEKCKYKKDMYDDSKNKISQNNKDGCRARDKRKCPVKLAMSRLLRAGREIQNFEKLNIRASHID